MKEKRISCTINIHNQWKVYLLIKKDILGMRLSELSSIKLKVEKSLAALKLFLI